VPDHRQDDAPAHREDRGADAGPRRAPHEPTSGARREHAHRDHPHRAEPPAPTPEQQRRRRAVRGSVSIGLVMALSGALFTANARLAGGADERQPQDLAGLQANEDARRERLFDEVTSLQASVDALTREQTDAEGVQWQSAGEAYDIAAGTVAVTGEGLVVRLDDAAADGPRPVGVGPDDLVVHQQDLQAVINALWAGGAEAMALMDQRVISTSAFQCIGNVLSLQGRRYSPPYEVTVIGDPDELRAALAADPAVRAYRSWVSAVGLGWEVQQPSGDLSVPAYDGAADLRHARVPDGTEVLPGLVSGTADAAPDDAATGTDQEDPQG
jgi:uncharacterized protein YlxW (UPF0749 family)